MPLRRRRADVGLLGVDRCRTYKCYPCDRMDELMNKMDIQQSNHCTHPIEGLSTLATGKGFRRNFSVEKGKVHFHILYAAIVCLTAELFTQTCQCIMLFFEAPLKVKGTDYRLAVGGELGAFFFRCGFLLLLTPAAS